jgi:hypothetical protein
LPQSFEGLSFRAVALSDYSGTIICPMDATSRCHIAR